MHGFKNLTKATFLTLCLSIGFIQGACTDKESPTTPEVKFSQTEYTFANTGGKETLTIQTNIPLEVVSANELWCMVTKSSDKTASDVQYIITIKPNQVIEARQTTITVSGAGFSGEITVTQDAGDWLEITNGIKSFECNKAGGEFTVALKTSKEFSVKIGSSWISQEEKNDAGARFSISANPKTTRSGTITFTCGNASLVLIINQDAGVDFITDGNAMEVAQSLGLGWNLGNQMDAHSNGVAKETAWGNNETTQEAFNKIAASGIQSVRIPVTWLGHIGAAPDYKIEATWLNRVAEIVSYAETAGLKAIVNIHHDGADGAYWLKIKEASTNTTVNNQVKAQIEAMWTQIAEKFKDKGNFLIFESMNEIHDGGWGWGANRTDGGKQYAVLNEWNQVFVNAVRATGGGNSNRYLGVPGYCTNPDLTINHFVLPKDIVSNRLMVAVHYYDPYEYALNDKFSEWGHTANISKKDSYGDEADVKSMFGKLKAKFVDKGIPVYIGEIGSVHRGTERAESFRKYYLEYICKAAKTYGLAPFYWDNGNTGYGKECLGLLDHATGNYTNNGKDVLDIMAKAITNEDTDYTLDAVYNIAP